MNMSLSGQPFGGRGELDVVGAAGDDAVSSLQSALDTDPLAVTCRDLDVATGESLPADLDEDVRATRLQQDGGVWHRGQTLTFSLIQHRGPRLADQQPTARIFDFELHRQRSRR